MEENELRSVIKNATLSTDVRLSAFSELVKISPTPQAILSCLSDDLGVLEYVSFSFWSDKTSSRLWESFAVVLREIMNHA